MPQPIDLSKMKLPATLPGQPAKVQPAAPVIPPVPAPAAQPENVIPDIEIDADPDPVDYEEIPAEFYAAVEETPAASEAPAQAPVAAPVAAKEEPKAAPIVPPASPVPAISPDAEPTAAELASEQADSENDGGAHIDPAAMRLDSSHNRETVYPQVKAEICSGANAVTAKVMKAIMGWETEKEYTLRMVADNPGFKDEDPFQLADGTVVPFGKAKVFGEAYMLLDEYGDKVQCWNNLDNRYFDDAWSLALTQTILDGKWAGEITIPDGGTVNGSTFVISSTGRVESGQHSGVALIRAHQKWEKDRTKYPFWANSTDGPVMETIIISGISEDPRVTMSVDNCKPRSEADVFYTSPLFRSLLPGARRECSRMLATAVDFLWKRLKTQGYKTHTEVVAFVDRHPKLLKCLEHIYIENSPKSGRKLAELRLSAGVSTALLYLMGSSGERTDGDVYRNGAPPQEKGKNSGVDWAMMTRAKRFFAQLGGSKELEPVRVALAQLTDTGDADSEPTSLGGRASEKLAIMAKAWEVYKNGRFPCEPDLELEYTKGEDGQLKLLSVADFGGLDVPEKPKIDPPAPNPEELAAAAEKERETRAKETAEKIRAMQMGAGVKPIVVKPFGKQ